MNDLIDKHIEKYNRQLAHLQRQIIAVSGAIESLKKVKEEQDAHSPEGEEDCENRPD